MHTLRFKPSHETLYKLNTSNFFKKFSNVEGLVSLAELEHEYFTIKHSDKNFQNSKHSNSSKTFTNTECLDRLNIGNKLFLHLYRPQTNFCLFYNLLSEISDSTSSRTFLHHRENGTQLYLTQVQNFRHRDKDPNKPFQKITFQQVRLLRNFANQHLSNTFKTFITPEVSVRYATLSHESSQNNNFEGKMTVSFECLKRVGDWIKILNISHFFSNPKLFLIYQRIQSTIYYTIYYTKNCYTIAPPFYTVIPPKPPVRTYKSVSSNPVLRFYRRPIDQSPISWSQTNRHRRG